jgi:hypothetical protein
MRTSTNHSWCVWRVKAKGQVHFQEAHVNLDSSLALFTQKTYTTYITTFSTTNPYVVWKLIYPNSSWVIEPCHCISIVPAGHVYKGYQFLCKVRELFILQMFLPNACVRGFTNFSTIVCASFGHGKPLGERITRAEAMLCSASHRPLILLVASP